MNSERPDPKRIEELLLGAERRYTRRETADLAGLDFDFARRLWKALGFAEVADSAVAFTEDDVTAARRVADLLATGVLDEEAAVRLVRAVGQTMARLADWQVDIVMSALLDPRDRPDPEQIRSVLSTAELLAPEFEKMLVYTWRRQLAATGVRTAAVAAANEDVIPSRVPLAVGFADLVSFTELSRQLDEVALAALVEGFEATAADVVAEMSGRMVKTLGDEVLFVAETPRVAAEIALQLADALGDDSGRRVRVGVAYGPVLPLMGDVFGTTVNLASRLTSFARPGTALVDEAMAASLAGRDDYQLVRIVRRPARGLGLVQPYVLRRVAVREWRKHSAER